MFDFFKKKNDPVQEHLGDFQESFTNEQKSAILRSLAIVAKADNQIHPKELQLMAQIAKILNHKSDDPLSLKIARAGTDELIRILNTLTQDQKEWFVVTLGTMAASDGKKNEDQFLYALGISEKIGISEEEMAIILQKSELLGNLFR
jgi:uncharacterized tellurite resistance protein B-like protein